MPPVPMVPELSGLPALLLQRCRLGLARGPGWSARLVQARRESAGWPEPFYRERQQALPVLMELVLPALPVLAQQMYRSGLAQGPVWQVTRAQAGRFEQSRRKREQALPKPEASVWWVLVLNPEQGYREPQPPVRRHFPTGPARAFRPKGRSASRSAASIPAAANR